MSAKRRCLICGKKYKPNHRTKNRQKYCSKTCRNIRWHPTKIKLQLIEEFLKDLKRHLENYSEVDDFVGILEKWEKRCQSG